VWLCPLLLARRTLRFLFASFGLWPPSTHCLRATRSVGLVPVGSYFCIVYIMGSVMVIFLFFFGFGFGFRLSGGWVVGIVSFFFFFGNFLLSPISSQVSRHSRAEGGDQRTLEFVYCKAGGVRV
jgi:hypothetical protein